MLIKLLLVEDDPVWRDCLTDYLGRDKEMMVISAVSTRNEAVQLCKYVDFDVVLMDIVLQERQWDGIEAALDILSIKSPKIIMLTSLDEDKAILDAFAAGAVNYMTKAHYTDIPNAIREAYSNQTTIHADAATILREEFANMKREELRNRLTPAEREVLRRLHEKRPKSTIPEQLYITESTFKKHVHRILKKLGVKTSNDAVDQARKRGLI